MNSAINLTKAVLLNNSLVSVRKKKGGLSKTQFRNKLVNNDEFLKKMSDIIQEKQLKFVNGSTKKDHKKIQAELAKKPEIVAEIAEEIKQQSENKVSVKPKVTPVTPAVKKTGSVKMTTMAKSSNPIKGGIKGNGGSSVKPLPQPKSTKTKMAKKGVPQYVKDTFDYMAGTRAFINKDDLFQPYTKRENDIQQQIIDAYKQRARDPKFAKLQTMGPAGAGSLSEKEIARMIANYMSAVEQAESLGKTGAVLAETGSIENPAGIFVVPDPSSITGVRGESQEIRIIEDILRNRRFQHLIEMETEAKENIAEGKHDEQPQQEIRVMGLNREMIRDQGGITDPQHQEAIMEAFRQNRDNAYEMMLREQPNINKGTLWANAIRDALFDSLEVLKRRKTNQKNKTDKDISEIKTDITDGGGIGEKLPFDKTISATGFGTIGQTETERESKGESKTETDQPDPKPPKPPTPPPTDVEPKRPPKKKKPKVEPKPPFTRKRPKPRRDDDTDTDTDTEDDEPEIENKKDPLDEKLKATLRPSFLVGGQDILRITDKQRLEEIENWNLYDFVPGYVYEGDDNPLTQMQRKQDAFRFKKTMSIKDHQKARPHHSYERDIYESWKRHPVGRLPLRTVEKHYIPVYQRNQPLWNPHRRDNSLKTQERHHMSDTLDVKQRLHEYPDDQKKYKYVKTSNTGIDYALKQLF
jgi:hypothetical protein